MKRTLIAATAALLMTTAAHAGDASCYGNVSVGPEWSVINGENDDTFCQFKTQSTIGQRILRKYRTAQLANWVYRSMAMSAGKAPIKTTTCTVALGQSPSCRFASSATEEQRQ